MKVTAFVIHQSRCSAINGKGYDFFVAKSGYVIPGAETTEPGRVHICLEGDYESSDGSLDPDTEEQFFVAARLIARLSEAFGVPPEALYPHRDGCPGARFPWGKLVLSISDGYH